MVMVKVLARTIARTDKIGHDNLKTTHGTRAAVVPVTFTGCVRADGLAISSSLPAGRKKRNDH